MLTAAPNEMEKLGEEKIPTNEGIEEEIVDVEGGSGYIKILLI